MYSDPLVMLEMTLQFIFPFPSYKHMNDLNAPVNVSRLKTNVHVKKLSASFSLPFKLEISTDGENRPFSASVRRNTFT